MKKSVKNSRIIGVLFILIMLTWGVGYALIGTILNEPDYLSNVYSSKNRIVAGSFFEILQVIEIMFLVVLLIPVIKKYSGNMANGYMVFRVLESVMILIISLAALLLIPLSAEYINLLEEDQSLLNSLASVLMGLRTDWGHFILTPLYGVGAILLNISLYKTRMVPSFISLWGLSAASLVIVNQLVIAFGNHPLEFVPGALMGLYELFLGAWLIIRGFNKQS